MADVLRFDSANARLIQGETEIPLTPKAMAVVEYFVSHAGKISTKRELLDNVWADDDVSEYALTSIIRDLRRALGDSTKKPRYIETVHRRGYRWIGEVEVMEMTGAVVSGEDHAPPDNFQPSRSSLIRSNAPEVEQPPWRDAMTGLAAEEIQRGGYFSGRTHELQQLLSHLQFVVKGQRQLVFLTGEAGIGKTALLNQFAAQIVDYSNCFVTCGQCIEKYGSGEAYRPILEALNRLCLTTEGQQFIEVLEQYAPSWLMQMPPLLTPEQLFRLRKQGMAPKERWLRELAEALEVITREHALVLILEDLHWSDPSTIELLEMLARRQESAKLLVLASYRPAEVNGSEKPLKHVQQELQSHGLCQEMPLKSLDQQAIEDYLKQRFPQQFGQNLGSQKLGSSLSALHQAATEIHQRTEGNPLFIVNVVEGLLERQIPQADADDAVTPKINTQKLASTGVPRNLRQLIHLQFDALDVEQQKILETASVEGAEFLSVTVAANLQMESEQVEYCLDELVQLNHLIALDDVDILPDGNLSTRYRFIHALYQEGLYQRLPKNRRVRLHRSLGAQLETIYGSEAHEVAAPLALHFEQGMDYGKAIGYRRQAGENALRRNAHSAAVENVHHGLALLAKVRQRTEQDSLELGLQTLLGTALMTIKGQAAPEVGQAYGRAQLLCQNIDATQRYKLEEDFGVTLGLWRHTFICGDLNKSLELGQKCLSLAEQPQAPPILLGHAHYALAGTLMYQGELHQALAHADAGLVAYQNLVLGQDEALYHSQDPCATLMAYRAWILFFLGYLEQAVQCMDEMLELEVVRSHPQTLVTSLTYSGILYMYLREFDLAQQQLEKSIQLALEWHIPQFSTIAQFFLTCTFCLLEQSGDRVSEMQETLDTRRAAGADLHATGYLNRLVEGYLFAGKLETSLTTLTQAFSIIEQNDEKIFESDSCRLMAELLLHSRLGEEEAESFFLRSLEIAKEQHSKIFELRVATKLAQLWNRQGKAIAAMELLSPVYASFTEGFEFFDLQQAKQLLGELSA